MQNNICFGRREGISLLANVLCAKLFLNLRYFMLCADNAGWILLLVNYIIFGVVVFLIIKYYPDDTVDILGLCDKYVGGWLKVIVSLIFFMYFFLQMQTSLKLFMEIIIAKIYERSPAIFIVMVFTVPIVFIASRGIETLTRTHALLIPYLSILIIIFPFMFFFKFDTTNLFPVFGSLFEKNKFTLSGGMSMFSEYCILLFIIPYLKKDRFYSSVGKWSVIIAGSLYMLYMLTYIFVVPAALVDEISSPFNVLTNLSGIAHLMERLDMIIFTAISFIWMLYLAAMLFFAAYSFKSMLNLEHQKPLTVPITICAGALSLLPMNHYIYTAAFYLLNEWSYTVYTVLPVVIFAVVYIVKNRGRESGVLSR